MVYLDYEINSESTGIRFLIQSSKEIEFLKNEIYSFVKDCIEKIRILSDSRFERAVNAGISEMKYDNYSSRADFNKLFSIWDMRKYQVTQESLNNVAEFIAELKSLTKEEFLECFESILVGDEKRLLVFQVNKMEESIKT